MQNLNRFSRIGFIFATAGSAVGLGNVWKFPYITGENGGGVFVLIYLLTILFVGISVFIAESYIGQKTNKNPVAAFQQLSKNSTNPIRFSGYAIFTALIILAFYVVVIGWILHYIVLSLTHLPSNVQEAQELFLGFLQQDIKSQVFYFVVVFLFIAFVISKGVKEGIERINKILMPTLIIILLGMLFYTMSLNGFGKAFHFLFYPEVAKFKTESILIAVGHAFFTLSIGMVVIATYAASLDHKVNIVKSSVIVAILDTVIALMAGLVIFTILFNANQEPSQGAGLVFITLPALFYEFGIFGNVLAVAFFVALAFAGITSAISILEPAVRYLEEEKNIPRKKGSYAISLLIGIVGLITLLANTTSFGPLLTFADKNLFDWFDYISSSILLPLGGILTAIFVGYFVDQQELRKHMLRFMSQKVYQIWLFSLRIIVPIAVGVVMMEKLGVFA
ncbi:MAG: sodium-dependent transporter [Campylobacterales bacterium]|nr:sodium-dependent transporter [Campylobacterales bacterium]